MNVTTLKYKHVSLIFKYHSEVFDENILNYD